MPRTRKIRPNLYVNWVVARESSQTKIDDKDKQLIRFLGTNSRISYQELGRKLRMSKVAVFKRINNLEKKRVILGYTCFIDFQRLGFDIFQLGIKLNGSPEEKTGYLQHISKNKFISQIITFSHSKWDFLIRFFAITENIGGLLEYFSHPLAEKFDLFNVEEMNFKKSVEIARTKQGHLQIDLTDLNILHSLAHNSKEPIYVIANKLGLSAKTVQDRIKKLIQKKILLSLITEDNPLYSGNEAFMGVITCKDRKKHVEITNRLNRLESSRGCLINLQWPDIFTFHVVENFEQLAEIELQIRNNNTKECEFLKIHEQSYYHFFPEGIYNQLKQLDTLSHSIQHRKN